MPKVFVIIVKFMKIMKVFDHGNLALDSTYQELANANCQIVSPATYDVQCA